MRLFFASLLLHEKFELFRFLFLSETRNFGPRPGTRRLLSADVKTQAIDAEQENLRVLQCSHNEVLDVCDVLLHRSCPLHLRRAGEKKESERPQMSVGNRACKIEYLNLHFL